MTRWTKRQSGGERTVIRVRFDVPKEMVDWIIEEHARLHGISPDGGPSRVPDVPSPYTEATALDWIRDHAAELLAMNTVAVDTEGELVVVHIDDLSDDHLNGVRVAYDGPGLV